MKNIIFILTFFIFLQTRSMELCDICGRTPGHDASGSCKDYHEARFLRSAIMCFGKSPSKATEASVLRHFKDATKKYQKQGFFPKDDYFFATRAKLALHALFELASLPRSKDLVRKLRHQCEWTQHDGIFHTSYKKCTFLWNELLTHAARCKEDTSTLEYLISRIQAKPDRENLYDYTPCPRGLYFSAVREAIKCGNVKALKILYPYAHKSYMTIPGRKKTRNVLETTDTLHYACQEGQLECFKFILGTKSIFIDSKDNDGSGRTLLSYAVENYYREKDKTKKEFIVCILDQGGNINDDEIINKIIEKDDIELAQEFLKRGLGPRCKNLLTPLLKKHGLLQEPPTPKIISQSKKQSTFLVPKKPRQSTLRDRPTIMRDRFSITEIIEHDDIGYALQLLEKDPALNESLAPLLQKHFLQNLKRSDTSIEERSQLWNYLSKTSRAQETVKMACTEECIPLTIIQEGLESVIQYLLNESIQFPAQTKPLSLKKTMCSDSPYQIRHIGPEEKECDGPPPYQTPPPQYQSREKLPSYESMEAEPINPPNPLGPYTQPLYTDDGSIGSHTYDLLVPEDHGKTKDQDSGEKEKDEYPNPLGPYALRLYSDEGSMDSHAYDLPLQIDSRRKKDDYRKPADRLGPYAESSATIDFSSCDSD